jgi:hypothetical protein
MHRQIDMHTRFHTHIHIYTHTNAYRHAHLCFHTHRYVDTHTHTHTQSSLRERWDGEHGCTDPSCGRERYSADSCEGIMVMRVTPAAAAASATPATPLPSRRPRGGTYVGGQKNDYKALLR